MDKLIVVIMDNLKILVALLLFAVPVSAQTLRTEFVSFDIREHAEKDNRKACQFYRDLGPDGTLEVPVLWLDREIFVHIEGAKGALSVNGNAVGEVRISPEEWNITPWITDGTNTIDVPQGARAWVYSQPKLRIEDFKVEAMADSTNYKWGLLRLTLVVANSYNFPEILTVGYDIYSPQGKLLNFDRRDVTVAGRSRDTVVMEEYIYGMPANFWTAENPKLHKGMILAQRGKRPTEYIPFRAGFGNTWLADGKLMRNGKEVKIKASEMSASTRADLAAKLKNLKKQGVNTLVVERPQPMWFYDMADETGFYVFEQVETFGAANDPTRAGDYLLAVESAFRRSKNHVSVVGWSLGAASEGTGYNLYKTYQWLKARAGELPVIYNGAAGEWNTDMAPTPLR
jgi:beta-galactosidase